MRSVVFAMLMLAGPELGSQEARAPEVMLLADSSVGRLIPAIGSLGYEPFEARRGPRPEWAKHSVDWAAVVMVALAVGPAAAAGAGNRLEAQRWAWAANVVDAAESDRALERLALGVLTDGLRERTQARVKPLRSPQAGVSVLPRATAGTTIDHAFVLSRRGNVPLVNLAAYDRHVVVAANLIEARRSFDRFRATRETRVSFVAQAAPGTDPRDVWAADGGYAVHRVVRRAMESLWTLATAPQPVELPKVGKEEVTLDVGGESMTFEGREWKRESDLVYLFDGSRGITIVQLTPLEGQAPPASAPAP